MKLTDHLEKLPYFYQAARLGSMKKAAEALFITQPSLTKSIKVLEQDIGHALFMRKPRGVELTPEGEILFQYCHKLFANITDLEQRLTHPDAPMAGSIRVGTYDSIAIYFWPQFLKKFLLKYPELDFELQTGRSHLMQQKLENNELDLIFIIEPQAKPQITVENIKTDYFKFYQAGKAKKLYVKQEDAPLILMPQALAGPQGDLDQALLTLGLNDRKLFRTSSLEAVKELTQNGLGIGLLPEMVANPPLKKNLLQEVKLKNIPKKGLGEHRIGFAYQSQRRDSQIIQTLMQELTQHQW